MELQITERYTVRELWKDLFNRETKLHEDIWGLPNYGKICVERNNKKMFGGKIYGEYKIQRYI